MKKIYFSILVIFLALALTGKSQDVYTTTGGEMVFQFADVNGDVSGNTIESTGTRWTVFLHLGMYGHMDINNNLGFYSGITMRNMGFITNERWDQDLVKVIRRTYNIGVPLAFKLGAFDKGYFLFAGGEYEWLFHYKEKTWVDGAGARKNTKVNFTEWFSNRTPSFLPSIIAGVQFPGGINLKFRYYLKNYMNKDYKNSSGDFPYQNFDVKLFSLSLSYNLRWNSIIHAASFHENLANR